VTRIDYLVSRWERLLGVAPPAAIPHALRGPVVALFGSLALIGVLAGVQQVRLAHAVHDVEIARLRLARSEASVHRVDALDAEVRRLRALDVEVERIERSGTEHASAIAAIGNEIPADAWLSAIRRERDGYALEGRSSRLTAVGGTLAALAALATARHARLVSVQDGPGHRGVSYAIVLDSLR
jgi:Tfp pilus assembly protein PilN